jgi:hypothetical protein
VVSTTTGFLFSPADASVRLPAENAEACEAPQVRHFDAELISVV